ncbi:hypothetical protein [Helicobacter mesocricetorum]|uniref:hypothetical protein n=1 Tax=Helicobacter mesocricetorum TaxID=87012 RepID=UPI000CF1BE4A|nr:hypothetical protein [Helicobacter mesocricetorum]
MKKIFLALVLMSLGSIPMLADIHGEIVFVNDMAKTITLSSPNGNIEIQIYPHTKLKGDDCGLFGMWDTYGGFSSLQPGMFVEIDIIPQAEGVFGAREVEWKCGRRAY